MPHLQLHIAALEPQQLCHKLDNALVGLAVHRLGINCHIQGVSSKRDAGHLEEWGGARQAAQGMQPRR